MNNHKKSEHILLIKSGNESKIFNALNKSLYRTSPLVIEILKLCNGKNNMDNIKRIIKQKHKIKNSEIDEFIMKLNKMKVFE